MRADDSGPGGSALSDGLGRPPERADFEAWAISIGLAYRNHHGVWFYRAGGELMRRIDAELERIR